MDPKKFAAIILLACALISSAAFAHPTGTMIIVGDHVLWPYTNPVDDPDHKACIMIWNKNSQPELFIRSQYPASDYMLYSRESEIYIIERKYLRATEGFEVRVLKATIGEKPEVIWDWFKDDWRIGEGGFFMLSDLQMVFGQYPDVYTLQKGGTPTKYFDFKQAIKRIRAVENNQLLLLGDNACYLTRQKWKHSTGMGSIAG